MSLDLVSLKKEEDGVTILSLKNPPVNAVSTKLLEEVGTVVAELAKDPAHRVLVITGAGQFFSAGADIKEIAAHAEEFLKNAGAIVQKGLDVYRAIETMPQPVICAINGLCIGGGMELALACDIRIAAESAKMGLPEVTLGLIPAYGGTQRLPRVVGLAKARELIFTGNLIDGKEAFRIGLVNKTVPSGQEVRAASDMAHTIAKKAAPLAVAAAKRSIVSGYDLDIESGLRGETQAFDPVSKSSDLGEGIQAQIEKRPAKFTGK